MGKIKHIVYLMLENRSLDNVLGWLYNDENPPKINIPSQKKPTYDGLRENTYFNLDQEGNKHFATKGTDNNLNVPNYDPNEKFENVNNQLFESKNTPLSPEPPTMGGFFQDYESTNSRDPSQIMQSYTPEELPVLNGLARHFAVSDRYFSSVPTQTNCNRAFAASGNSLGFNDDNQLEAWVNNRNMGLLAHPRSRQFNQRTMWNVLIENGKDQINDWMLYNSKGNWWQDLIGLEGYNYTRQLMIELQKDQLKPHFGEISTFLEKAKEGSLPTFSFLEPEWGLLMGTPVGTVGMDNGNDYHPPTNLAPGEAFVKSIYEALTSNSEAWKETLWIINFDEHGGTYDHVAPPWNAATPWSNEETPKPEISEGNFEFNRFGVRVPLILVSPYVEESTVFRAEGDTPYDHTSVIATILNLMEIPKEKWQLGGRTANAPSFENILTRSTPRTDIPSIEVNQSALSSDQRKSSPATINVPPNDIHLQIAQNILDQIKKKKNISQEDIDSLSLKPLAKAKSVSELSTLLSDSLKKINDLL